MKIREIRAVGLRGATPEGGWSNELRPDDCVHTLMAVLTDEGPTGLGSVSTNDDLVRSALAVLEPLYRGENALEPERVGEKLRQHMFWLGRGGSITHAISGIDIALWDLLGKATGQPVYKLLGGYRSQVTAYCSTGSLLSPEEHVDQAWDAYERGYRAIKVRLHRPDLDDDLRVVRAVREALPDEMQIMADANQAQNPFWSRATALRAALALQEMSVVWLEEVKWIPSPLL